ncbi:MAG: hypothetical protein ACRDJW_22425 [Thermomicrobiales bacterium]
MTLSLATALRAGLLALSVGMDAAATVYLKIAGDRIEGMGFFMPAVLGMVMCAPSIMLFDHALTTGSSYFATVGFWAVRVYAVNL